MAHNLRIDLDSLQHAHQMRWNNSGIASDARSDAIWKHFLVKEAAWGRVRGSHAQPRHGCMHRNLGALIAWQQRDAVDGGTEHGYREVRQPKTA